MRIPSILASCALIAMFAGSCSSDTSDERRVAGDLGDGCTINSDCEHPYICAFERCHEECKETWDCDAPAQCVQSETGLGVCQLSDDIYCDQNDDCQGEQVCSDEGVCRDACNTPSDCLPAQTCVGGYCEDRPQGSGGNAGSSGTGGASGASGMSGTGGTGGVGGTGGGAGSSGTGGGAGSSGADGGAGASGAGGASGAAGAGGASGAAGTAGASGADGGAGATNLPAPVAYWPMDSIGGAMIDSIGTLHGEYMGGENDANAKVGGAARFNVTGTNELVLVDADPALTSSTAVALSVWIKPAITLNSSAGTRVIAQSGPFALYYSAGNLVFRITPLGGANVLLSVPATFAPNVWKHIVASYDVLGGDTLRLFVDGVEIGTPLQGPGSISITASALLVGAGSTAGQNSFIGSLDELSFFKQGLGQAEVTALYNAGSAAQAVTDCSGCPTPAAHWKLDDNPIPVVADAIGTNPGVNEDGSVPTDGKVGTGVLFVDAEDMVSIPNSTTLNPTAALTIALWVRPTTTLSGTSPRAPFFDKEQSGNGYVLMTGDGQHFRALIGGTVAPAPGVTFTAQTWHHLAGTWDGSFVRLYIDGQMASEKAKTTPLSPHTGPGEIGGTGGALSGAFYGTVDEVALWDVALSGAEIQKLYDLGNQGKPLH